MYPLKGTINFLIKIQSIGLNEVSCITKTREILIISKPKKDKLKVTTKKKKKKK